MPADPSTAASSRVCILILTYKRNAALLRVANQCREVIDKYRGHNRYELCVSDSDRSNPIAPLPPHLKAKYFMNPGSGFDDNLFYFWLNNLETYDYIFSLSDDDLFAPWLNPLYLLDAAIDTGKQVAMFNHRYYTSLPNGNMELGGVNYPEMELVFDKTLLLRRVLTTLPSHVGILYSTKLLRVTLGKAWEFRNTLHLYAVPVLLAAASDTLLFSDHVLCLYHNARKTDGAWSVSENVFDGLVDFLVKLKRFLPPNLYSIAEAGFFSFYFHSNSWLRQQLAHHPNLKSETQIRELLTASPS